MSNALKPLSEWSAEERARGAKWVRAWQSAGPLLESLRRKELRELDGLAAIAALCGSADYRVPPRAPRPTSGLVEQQRWFKRAAGRD